MKRILALSLSLLLLTVSYGCAQELEWLTKMRTVKLLEHSYHDVIGILGTPEDGSSEPELAEKFTAKNGSYFVVFSSGLCVVTDYSGGRPIGWKVLQFTAITISFTAKKKIKPKNLGLDLSAFKKFEIDDVPGAFTYENDEMGIEFGVRRNGFVEILGLNPPAKFDHLHCDYNGPK